MELDRYHSFMEERDVSGRAMEAKAAELAHLSAELRSSLVEVNRLQDELEKTRQQAKVQLIELEKVKEEKRQMFFQQEALKQELARVKDETIGKLTLTRPVLPTHAEDELREALAQSQGQLMEALATRPTSSPSASPKSVELPENQLHSELFGMKQSLSKQDTVIGDLQTQLTALRSETSYLNQLAALREQRRLEAQDEIMRLKGELQHIERRNFVGTQLEKAAEDANLEAERLVRELQKKDECLNELVQLQLGLELKAGSEALEIVRAKVPDLLEQVQSLQGHLKQRGELLSSVARALGSTEDFCQNDAELWNFVETKVRQLKVRSEQLSSLVQMIGPGMELHESEVADFIQSKVQGFQKQMKDKDRLLSDLANTVADLLDTLGLADLDELPSDPIEATRLVMKTMQETEDAASDLKKFVQAKAKAKSVTVRSAALGFAHPPTNWVSYQPTIG
eukprot:symbB.v1.2.001280.t1/scaffold68.1/size354569/2